MVEHEVETTTFKTANAETAERGLKQQFCLRRNKMTFRVAGSERDEIYQRQSNSGALRPWRLWPTGTSREPWRAPESWFWRSLLCGQGGPAAGFPLRVEANEKTRLRVSTRTDAPNQRRPKKKKGVFRVLKLSSEFPTNIAGMVG